MSSESNADSNSDENYDAKLNRATIRHIHSLLPSVRVSQTLRSTRKRSLKPKSEVTGNGNEALELEEHEFGALAVSAGTESIDELEEDVKQMTSKGLSHVKTLPRSMQEKRLIRDRLLLKDEALRKLNIRGRTEETTKNFKKFSSNIKEFARNLKPWERSIHQIEGRFGSSVRSYFAFLRWLFFLNIIIFILIFIFIVIPSITFVPFEEILSTNSSIPQDCEYKPYDPLSINSFTQYFIWCFTGQGFMENTLLFIGYYKNTETQIVPGFRYNIPLAYLCVAGSYFLVSLLLLISRASRGLKESLINDDDRLYSYCNNIFCGWDFCISDTNTAKIKHQSIYNEIKTCIAEEKIKALKKSRTRKQKINLYLKRFFINLVVIAVLVGALIFIFFSANFALRNYETYNKNFVLDLLVTYLVSIVITILNIIAPFIFGILIEYEGYSPDFAIKFTLLRTVLLRLASVVFLYLVVYFQITCDTNQIVSLDRDDKCGYCPGTQCWETYMGQEMYKLTILDFFVVVFYILFVEFPRKLIVNRYSCKLSKFIGEQEFRVPGKVLDVVYSQTICWIGSFYAPLLPGIVVIKFFCFFYLQKISLMYNCKPASKSFRSSRSGTFFFIVLFFGFVVACIPVIVGMSILTPSRYCGPFREESKMFSIITKLILTYPTWVQRIFWFIGSPGFVVILGVIIIFGIYYFKALDNAHNKMIKVLRDQLLMEGKDKQFLLQRVTRLSQCLEQKGIQFSDFTLKTAPQLQHRPMHKHEDQAKETQDGIEMTQINPSDIPGPSSSNYIESQFP